MMVMRECVRRFGRLPQILVMDGGPEFSSVYFETLLARYEITQKKRPKAAGRGGSILERMFGTTNTQFFDNLQGNTQIMRNVRQVTKSVNPKNQAIWTLESMDEKLTEYFYEVYDTIEHPALCQTPRDAFAASMSKMGSRLHRLIRYDDEFKIFTSPTTPRGQAKVTVAGMKINNIRYWSDAFRHPEVMGTCVPNRFDPWDAGKAYAFVRGNWVQCHSEYYSTFHNRSEREIRLATDELRRRKGRHSQQFKITAAKLARFLESLDAEEVLLRQRLSDLAVRTRLWAIDGEGQTLSQLASMRAEPPASVSSITPAGDQDSEEDFPEKLNKPTVKQLYGEF